MELKSFDEINEKLKTELKHSRYVHTLGVAFTASSMAMRFDVDVQKALLAGLLHDCAKCFSDEEKFRLCEEGGVELSESEKANTALIHAKLGPYIAKRDYGVDDEEVLDAIRTHTTGAPEMTDLQKIIFTADLIEPNREKDIPGMELFRKLAFTNLDMAVMVILKRQLDYLESVQKSIDPASRETYDYYKKLVESREK